MSIADPAHERHERLIAALETQNKHLRRLSFCSMAVACALGVLALAGWKGNQIPDTIRARQFEVVNSNGRSVAVLGQAEFGAGGLWLNEYTGALRFSASAIANKGFVLGGYDQFGVQRFLLGDSVDPIAQQIGLEFTGTEGTVRLGSNTSGGGIEVQDRNGKTVLSLATGKTGAAPALQFVTPNGHMNLGSLRSDGLGLELFGRWTQRPLVSLRSSGGKWPRIELSELDWGEPGSTWGSMNGHASMSFINRNARGEREGLLINDTPNKIRWTDFKATGGSKAVSWPPDPAKPTAPAKKPAPKR